MKSRHLFYSVHHHRRFVIVVMLLFVAWIAPAQKSIVAKKVDFGEVPKELKFRGKLVEAWQWKDKLGDNVLLLSSSGPYADVSVPNSEGTTIELFAYQYAKNDTAYRLLWRLHDLEKACNLDITAAFFKGATSITDLDKDGIAESTIQYSLACRGDISPAYMKLIMHEDSIKFALRGSRWNKWLQGDSVSKFSLTEQNIDLEKIPKKKDEYDQLMQSYGRYETQKYFLKAPPEFIKFARRQWLKYVKETFE